MVFHQNQRPSGFNTGNYRKTELVDHRAGNIPTEALIFNGDRLKLQASALLYPQLKCFPSYHTVYVLLNATSL